MLTEENLRGTFLALSGGKEKNYINENDIKKFIFRDANIQENIFNEYLEQFGMKKDEKISFEQFYDIIKYNKKLHSEKDDEEEDNNNEKKLPKNKAKNKGVLFKDIEVIQESEEDK